MTTPPIVESDDPAAQIVIGRGRAVTARERGTLLVAVLIISICALVYELVVGAVSSYLLGNSVTQYSLTIGLFLSAMGIGAAISRRIRSAEVRWFILIEVLTGLFGGLSATILWAAYTSLEQYYYLIMAATIMAIGICVGLEIPLLTRIVANRADLSKTLADVLSIDYLGALIGSILFPLVLLPSFSPQFTAFMIGLLNVLVAGITLWTFRERVKPRARRWLWVLVVVLSVLLIAGAVASDELTRLFEQQLYTDTIFYRKQTPYQRIVMTIGEADDYRLYLDGNLQFSSRDEYRYHEPLVHPVMSLTDSHASILVLGGGDGLVARELLKYPDVQQITVVDLDPAMTQMARTFTRLQQMNGDSMNDPRVHIVNEDAFKFVEQTEEQFHVVIIDLPDPNNEGLSKLYSQQFYKLLRMKLAPDGVFITQATSPYFSRRAFWSIAHTVAASGFKVIPLTSNVPSFGEWGFVIGTVAPPRSMKMPPPEIALRFLTADVLRSVQTFDPDTSEVPTEINTLSRPILLTYYDQDWRQWD
ncbi:MAG: polyamine aminopropyltransferase [Anaerolineae bacterium]|nr:polyamine aminopropyltransferase [Anaerolineae bacterium]